MTYTHKMTALPESYDTAAIEKKWQLHWLTNKTYAWDENESRENSYVIDTPPPTVSGTLHMGHVFSYTQADFIARFQRMSGKNVFYPMGFDDNGLPTERLVEKSKKIRAVDMSREKFIEECLSVSEEARKEFRALFESIALSVDWAQEYHTISDDARRLSQLSFLDLVNKGHAYRELRPFYWDPVDQTAIAQAEIVDKEMAGFQHVILFTVIPAKAGIHVNNDTVSDSQDMDPGLRRGDEEEQVGVMTTRPELLPACVALMCHPDDAHKYQGKVARTPLFNIEIPIIADEKVDREKGTGLVMCCTFGDDTDKEWWLKHRKQYNLPTRVILNKFGKLDFSSLRHPEQREGSHEILRYAQNDTLYTALENKKTTNPDPKHLGARETIIALLKETNLLTESKPITHPVKCAERSGAPLEILPTHQWFVRVLDKKEALKAKSKECAWHPEWMAVRMEQWIDGLNQDWCISRQRYFGVPFPVWYVESPVASHQSPAIVVARPEDLPCNPLADVPHGYEKLEALEGNRYRARHIASGEEVIITPDADVMDTWATSSISPQLSAKGLGIGDWGLGKELSPQSLIPNPQSRFSKLFPADLRPQAHEIIRTWAFYTIVKSHLHNDLIPWNNLMISGWCLAEDKSKMSKSKGNVVTPVALIEEKGTDAVRYWAGTSRLGADTAFSPDVLKIGKKLVTKLWNATQFASIHLHKMADAPLTPASDTAITEILDQWILSRLAEVVKKSTDAFANYEYADALDATNQFFWADFCDNYLELIKKRVYNENNSFTATQQQSAVRALYYCIHTILKLYAPFIPHVTEELFFHIFAAEYAKLGSLHARGTWPTVGDFKECTTALAAGEATKAVLEAVRKAKSDAAKSVKWPVESITAKTPESISAAHLTSVGEDLKGAGNIRELRWGDATAITLAAEADAA